MEQTEVRVCIACGVAKPLVDFALPQTSEKQEYGHICRKCKKKILVGNQDDDDSSGGGKQNTLKIGLDEKIEAKAQQDALADKISEEKKDYRDEIDKEQKDSEEKSEDSKNSDNKDAPSEITEAKESTKSSDYQRQAAKTTTILFAHAIEQQRSRQYNRSEAYSAESNTKTAEATSKKSAQTQNSTKTEATNTTQQNHETHADAAKIPGSVAATIATTTFVNQNIPIASMLTIAGLNPFISQTRVTESAPQSNNSTQNQQVQPNKQSTMFSSEQKTRETASSSIENIIAKLSTRSGG